MAAKQIQRFVVGEWVEGKFVPAAVQPPEPITEVSKMIAWTKKEYGQKPGCYEFIRQVQGAWVCGQRTLFSFAQAGE